MSSSNSSRGATPATSPGAALFSEVISSALGVVAAKVDDWTDRLNDVAAGGGGAKQQAGVRAVQAGLEGKNPVWAAIKGAWTGGSTSVKVAIVAAGVVLIVLLVLSPVLLVVLLVTVPIVVAVSKSRSAKK